MSLSQIRGKKILITGGTGYIGSLLLKKLSRLALVTVLTRDPDSFRSRRPELLWPELSTITGDIETFVLSEDNTFDFVIHGGNPSSPKNDEIGATTFRKTTVEGTQNLLRQIDKLARPPERLLVLSSGAVYGPIRGGETHYSEDFECAPLDVYGQSKLAVEEACRKFAEKRKIGLTLARIFACAGPYIPISGRFALGQFIGGALSGARIDIHGDGKAKRTYLDGEELAAWLLTLLAGRSNFRNEIETYNVGSDDEVSIAEVAGIVKEIFVAHGKAVGVRLQVGDSSSSPNYLPSILKIKNHYGLVPLKSSTESIQSATEWVINSESGRDYVT